MVDHNSTSSNKEKQVGQTGSWLQLGRLGGTTNTTYIDPSHHNHPTLDNIIGLNLELNLFSSSSSSSSSTNITTPQLPTTLNLIGTASSSKGLTFLSPPQHYQLAPSHHHTEGCGLITPPHHHHHHHHMMSSFLATGSISPASASTSSSLLSLITSAGVNGPDFSVIDPPPRRPHSGFWFMLQASTHQAKEPFLPQVAKSFLRIKDIRMTVGIVMKYLANKLGLDNHSQVEIRCRGQQLVPFLTLQHVRDNIWSSRDAMITLLPNSSMSDYVMVLNYGRSTTTSLAT